VTVEIVAPPRDCAYGLRDVTGVTGCFDGFLTWPRLMGLSIDVREARLHGEPDVRLSGDSRTGEPSGGLGDTSRSKRLIRDARSFVAASRIDITPAE